MGPKSSTLPKHRKTKGLEHWTEKLAGAFFKLWGNPGAFWELFGPLLGGHTLCRFSGRFGRLFGRQMGALFGRQLGALFLLTVLAAGL
jgi:hypothetical protein